MPTLEVNGREVEIDESFLAMSPAEQERTVDEIALSLSRQAPDGSRVDPGHANVPEFQPVGVEGYNPETGMVEHSQGMTGTAVGAMPEGVPFIGGMLDKGVLNASAGLGSVMSGRSFDAVKQEMAGMRDRGREQNPGSRLAGNVAGSIATLGPVARTTAGALAFGLKGPNLAARSAASGLSGATIAGGDTLARGGSVDDAQRNALLGLGIGSVIPAAGRAISQMGTSAAAKSAPTLDSMRTAGNALYERAFSAGIAVKPKAYDAAMWKAAADLRKFGFDADLQPRTAAVLGRLSQARGKPVDLQELDNLRRVAMNAATGGMERSDRKAAWIVINAIDGLVDDAANFGFGRANAPAAPGAAAVNPAESLSILKEARSLWSTMRKTETVERMFNRAAIKAEANSGPAFARALRAEFKRLALRENGMRGFTAAERRLLLKAAEAGASEKLVGGIGSFLRGVTGSGVGGAAGFAVGGPAGIPAFMIGSHLAGRGLGRVAARSGVKSAQRALTAVRTGQAGPKYAPNVPTPLETLLRPAPLLTYDRGPK